MWGKRDSPTVKRLCYFSRRPKLIPSADPEELGQAQKLPRGGRYPGEKQRTRAQHCLTPPGDGSAWTLSTTSAHWTLWPSPSTHHLAIRCRVSTWTDTQLKTYPVTSLALHHLDMIYSKLVPSPKYDLKVKQVIWVAEVVAFQFHTVKLVFTDQRKNRTPRQGSRCGAQQSSI